MDKLSRRSLLRPSFEVPIPIAAAAAANGVAASGRAGVDTADGTSRRAFLQGTAGAAAGAAVVLGAPKVASIVRDAPGSSVAGEPKPVAVKPSGPAPREPVTAFVRNAEHGEVTVMSGKREITYRDPVLVKRLLDAAR
jgi:hypothetical protein